MFNAILSQGNILMGKMQIVFFVFDLSTNYHLLLNFYIKSTTYMGEKQRVYYARQPKGEE